MCGDTYVPIVFKGTSDATRTGSGRLQLAAAGTISTAIGRIAASVDSAALTRLRLAGSDQFVGTTAGNAGTVGTAVRHVATAIDSAARTNCDLLHWTI